MLDLRKGGCGINNLKFNPEIREKFYTKVRKELGISPDTIVVGIVGRIVWEKGFKEIVDAAHELRNYINNFQFIILGENFQNLEGIEIKRYVKAKNLTEEILFLGYKFEINYYMSAFDIFVLPSYREGLPISLLEAMALGVPCIATNIRGNCDLIKENITGILIPAKDHFALSEAIMNLLKNPTQSKKLGLKAAKFVSENFSEKKLVKKTMGILLELITNKYKIKNI